MSEHRRLKIKFGDVEFEADVPESNVQPMYDRFLSVLEQRPTLLFRQNSTNGKVASVANEQVGRDNSAAVHTDISTPDDPFLTRVFYLSPDNFVLLKVLPNGPGDALLLLLYGYRQLKSEPVSAVELSRAADQSGISLRPLSNAYANNHRYLVRGGYGKGSHYRLNSEGLATAKAIMATVLNQTESAASRTADDASFVAPQLSSFGSGN